MLNQMMHSLRLLNSRKFWHLTAISTAALGIFLCLYVAPAKAQIVDPLAVALTNAGLDPSQAGAYASALELTFANTKAIIALDQSAHAVLQQQLGALSNRVDVLETMKQSKVGTCNLFAGICFVVFAPAFTTTPTACIITPTTSSTAFSFNLAATLPTTTGFTITSPNASDNRTVGWICE